MTYTNTFNISGIVIANGGRYVSNGRDVWCTDDQSISTLNDWE